MVALRSFGLRRDDADGRHPVSPTDPADWLTLQQAACELNVSASTVRRRIRKGELRNRIVPRRGGFAYLVYLPNNRHGRGLGTHGHGDVPDGPADGNGHAPVDLAQRRRARVRDEQADGEVHRLQQQVDALSAALARALRVRQKALPAGIGSAVENPDDPYARYRWLVRRRRWWPF